MTRSLMKQLLLFAISLGLSACGNKERADTALNSTSLVIAAEDDPHCFDPRLMRDTCSINIAHMLYEGLFFLDNEDTPRPALAERVAVDPSMTTYTFTLRNAKWSNGDPIEAKDFELSIKSIMDPSHLSPHANQLYMIKGAKEAKEGKIPVDKVAIKAIDQKTLRIELEEPTPYFLTLAATHFLYPVHESTLNGSANPQKPVVSGPFEVVSFAPQNELILKKNPHFWDAAQVKLTHIKVLPLNDQTALQLFKQGEIDWVGSPIGRLPPDAVPRLKEEGKLKVKEALGTFWIRVNTLDATLRSKQLRQTLLNHIDRDKIVEHITQGGQEPALAVVPPALWGKMDDESAERRTAPLSSLKSEESLPTLSLIYIHNERNHKIAQFLQQEWKQKLGIALRLEAQESKSYYERVGTGNFQLSIGSWFADIPDPVNFLDIFKFKHLKTNGTGWEDARYIALLDKAAKEGDPGRRLALLRQSEALLLEEAPVIPLYFAAWNWVGNPKLQNVHLSPIGFFDLRHAYKKER
ncbi:peptide ABC transporter substrate-binding protein [Estrella lausannensis]|uniref:ABC-type transporter, substrate-binding protein n=1 Tax=Estrella lausannensis TaxID=483423 RepID=A0A0H5DNZ4_9BACT|nr:peptide ABC transporter substrate-binding protein [Estrella lausannensis]CRX38171.1 ABC-type transporter, substrate-binding protein [Estrella lausannensis]